MGDRPERDEAGVPAVAAFADACLRVAARRQPADVRDEQLREWRAELHAVRTDSQTGAVARAVRQLGFAVSLAVAPPTDGGTVTPHGWRAVLPRLGTWLYPVLALLLAAVVASLPVQFIGGGVFQLLAGAAGGGPAWAFLAFWSAALVVQLVVSGFVAWWIARRVPMWWAYTGRLGAAGPAVFAPAVLTVAIAVAILGNEALAITGGGIFDSFAAATLVWLVLSAVLGVAVVRLVVARRALAAAALAVVGVLVTTELATAAAALPPTLQAGTSLADIWLWAPAMVSTIAGADPGGWFGAYNLDASVATFNSVSPYPTQLPVYGAMALAYGLAARHGTKRVRVTAPAIDTPRPNAFRLPAVGRAAGLTAVAVAVLAWAVTLTIGPGIPTLGAPIPGGDGELYMWVHELRWGAILLAVCGLLLATADRAAAPLAAAVFAGALLASDAVLARVPATGPRGVLWGLAAGAAAAGIGWWIAGSPRRETETDTVRTRRRLTFLAVVAAYCAPQLLGQGTPVENHPFLPPALWLATAAVPAATAVVAVLAAVAVRQTPLPRVAYVALVALPALILAGFGAATGLGIRQEWTFLGLTSAVPLVVAVVAVMRPPRRRVATIALAVAGLPASAVLAVVGLYISLAAVAHLLFALADSSYPADGASLLPGGLVLALSAGVTIAQRLHRTTRATAATRTTAVPEIGAGPVRPRRTS